MASRIFLADANPEKSLFISLLTRDLSLISAFLDLIDNSINAAVEPLATKLITAGDYLDILSDPAVKPTADIKIDFTANKIQVSDTASGISLQTAREHTFRFGRSPDDANALDRLSVYGIGLKRAIFKLGRSIQISSDHISGGFDLDLDVNAWARSSELPWKFEIIKRSPVEKHHTGTKISVENIHENIKSRIEDGIFEGQLRDTISRTYTFFMQKFVNIFVNGKKVETMDVNMGENRSTELFSYNDVTYAISAGLSAPIGGSFRDSGAGWFIYCNGRAVVVSDKTILTGWGGGIGLPIFQPKHRPFIGIVFFVSENPEALPWNTTKSSVNEDSFLWQLARRQMQTVGKPVITFLDRRYTPSGTDVNSKQIEKAAGAQRAIINATEKQGHNKFQPPKSVRRKMIKVQFDAAQSDIDAIAQFVGREFSGSEAGRYTFNYFLDQKVKSS